VIAWTSAWLRLRPLWQRRAVVALAAAGLMVAVVAVSPWLLIVLPAVAGVAFLGGLTSAALEIWRERRASRTPSPAVLGTAGDVAPS
jgi:hypothetical protein